MEKGINFLVRHFENEINSLCMIRMCDDYKVKTLVEATTGKQHSTIIQFLS